MTFDELISKYQISSDITEAELELLTAAHYKIFIADLKTVYRDNYKLLNAFLHVSDNFARNCSSICPRYAKGKLNDLFKLHAEII